MTDAAAIARGLSAAMRAGLLRKPCRSWWGDVPACMPIRHGTAPAIERRGLGKRSPDCGAVVVLNDLGLAVRAELERMEDSPHGP